MKSSALAVICLGALLVVPFAYGQQGGAPGGEPYLIHPKPPAPPGDFTQKAQPVNPHAARFDAVKARRDAQELAELARKIQDEIELVSKNVLPKDLEQNLKRAQKLAKELRAQVSP